MITLEAAIGKIILNHKKALKIELELNVSSKAREWLFLGDALYDAHAKGKTQVVKITDEQFFWVLRYV